MTFQQQLVITILDKAIIGLVVVLAGFFLTRALERFKSERALSNELAKQRVAKIAELWEALYKWEADVLFNSNVVRKSIFLTSDNEISLAMEAYMPGLTNLAGARAKEVSGLIDRSRFWLGDPLYLRFRRYYDAILGYLALLLERPRSAVQPKFDDELKETLNASRQSITDYLGFGYPRLKM